MSGDVYLLQNGLVYFEAWVDASSSSIGMASLVSYPDKRKNSTPISRSLRGNHTIAQLPEAAINNTPKILHVHLKRKACPLLIY